jgi:hypothetical protein
LGKEDNFHQIERLQASGISFTLEINRQKLTLTCQFKFVQPKVLGTASSLLKSFKFQPPAPLSVNA